MNWGFILALKNKEKWLNQNSVFVILVEIGSFLVKLGKSKNWALKLDRNFYTRIYS